MAWGFRRCAVAPRRRRSGEKEVEDSPSSPCRPARTRELPGAAAPGRAAGRVAADYEPGPEAGCGPFRAVAGEPGVTRWEPCQEQRVARRRPSAARARKRFRPASLPALRLASDFRPALEVRH